MRIVAVADDQPDPEDGCGCILCDIGDDPKTIKGTLVHEYRADELIVCTKGLAKQSTAIH